MTAAAAATPDRSFSELRVLVLAPRGRDAALTCDLLTEAGLSCERCADVEELCRRIAEGAGAAIVAAEAIPRGGAARIAEQLARQPAWSDFPFVVFADLPRADPFDDTFAALGNLTLLDRPVKIRTMIAAARAAIRSRARQYEARAAIESRDEFLAMLGHELRNPLGAIRLAVELASRGANREACTRELAVIDRHSKHLARLVDDLLDVARVEHGKVRIEMEPLDLREVLRAAVDAQQDLASAHGLAITLDVASPLHVVGDRARLDQIFTNVLTNAIKYTPRDGRVRVDARREGSSALVSVADTGIGIDPPMLGRVFDLFAQVDRSLDRSQGGMGLGLTLVRRLLNLHGASIEAKSEGLGKGSEFVIRLPLMDRPMAVVSRAVETSTTSSLRRRVLVVDDSEDIRTMVKELLENDGHDVATAEDGPAAVARILGDQPDIAFVDIGLPGFDGYEVARRVRAQRPAGTVLVAVTGYGQADDRTRARAAGFDGHLTKPVSPDTLQAMIASVRRPA